MGKKLIDLKKKVDVNFLYDLQDAINILQKNKITSFDESLDIALRLGVDAKNSAHNVRGNVILPHGVGKDLRLAVVCPEILYSDVEKEGVEIFGSSNIIDAIKNKNINFDTCICDASMIGLVSSVAKILGPKGLMPNIKNGTLTSDVISSIKNLKKGQIDYKIDKNAIIHSSVGRLSFVADKLVNNVKTFIEHVKNSKPQDFKGVFIKNLFISPTMGLGLKVSLLSF